MKRYTWIIMIAILAVAAVPASAQFGKIKKAIKKKPAKTSTQTAEPKKESQAPASSTKPAGKTVNKDLPPDPNIYYIGANDIAGTSVGELKVCSDSLDWHKVNWKKEFKHWSDAMSDNALQKSFHAGQCELLGKTLQPDKRGAMYSKVDDLKDMADGLSVYQVEKGEMVLIKSFAAATLYVAVAPRAAKEGLTMKDLVLCVSYALRGNYKKHVKMTSGCNSIENRLDNLGYYKEDKNPDEWKVNSALFEEAEYNAESKKGTLKGYKIYTVIGSNLQPLD